MLSEAYRHAPQHSSCEINIIARPYRSFSLFLVMQTKQMGNHSHGDTIKPEMRCTECTLYALQMGFPICIMCHSERLHYITLTNHTPYQWFFFSASIIFQTHASERKAYVSSSGLSIHAHMPQWVCYFYLEKTRTANCMCLARNPKLNRTQEACIWQATHSSEEANKRERESRRDV